MAELHYARITGDWRRIVGNLVVSHEVKDITPAMVSGTVTLTPRTQGITGTDGAFYTFDTLPCRILWGLLYHPYLDSPYQDVVVAVDDTPVEWEAAIDVWFKPTPDSKPRRVHVPNLSRFTDTDVRDGIFSITGFAP